MNAEQWLDRATRDLPAGVSARIRADTLAHLQDAAVPEGRDVRAVLGDPETTADELKRLYLTRKELEAAQGDGPLHTGLHLTLWGAGVVWPSLLTALVAQTGSGRAVLALALHLAVMGLSWSLHPLRRRQWWLWSLFAGLAAVQWIPHLWTTLGGPLGLLWPAALLFLGWTGLRRQRDDARLSRTLALEGGRA